MRRSELQYLWPIGIWTGASCTPFPCANNQVCTECVDDQCMTCDLFAGQMGYIVHNGKCKYCMGQIFNGNDILVCDTCQSGSHYADNGKCVSCSDPHCERCTSNGSCVVCAYPYGLLNGACVPCTIEHCIKCDSGDASKCDECAGGPSNSACLPCGIDKCLRCEDGSPDECRTCEGSRTWNGTMCVLECEVANCTVCSEDSSDRCSKCEDNYVVSPSGACDASASLDVAEVCLIIAGCVVFFLLCVGAYCCHLANKQKRSFAKDNQRNAADSAPPGEVCPMGIPVPKVANVPYAKRVQ